MSDKSQENKGSEVRNTPTIILSHGGLTIDTTVPFMLQGYGDGHPHEDDMVTRAQIAVLLYRSLTRNNKDTPKDNVNLFSDVPTGTWYYDAVSTLASAGIIVGHNGLYCPKDNLTWGQLITILTRFVEAKTIEMPKDIAYSQHWAYDYIMTAVAYGWIDDINSFVPDKPITRGEAVKFVNLIFGKCR